MCVCVCLCLSADFEQVLKLEPGNKQATSEIEKLSAVRVNRVGESYFKSNALQYCVTP